MKRTFGSRIYQARTFAPATLAGRVADPVLVAAGTDGWVANRRARVFVASSRTRVWVAAAHGNVWLATERNH